MGKIIAVVSGKGGTGKTSFTANVGLALAALGCHTLCLDCDITLRNLDLALGLSDRALMDFTDVIAGRCTLEDAVVQHPKYPKLHLLTAPLSARPMPIAPEQMKEVIAINGSSPAFIYLFAKGFLDYAARVGLPEQSAKELFVQSLIGSAKMITDSGYSIDELIRQVSSPGGTTLAGLDQLYEGKMLDAVQNACDSCTKRAYELSK